MITKKKLQQQVNELTQEIKKLNEIVVTEELKNLRATKKLFDEQTELISNVKFKVKSVKFFEEDNGSSNIIVTYQLPIIIIKLDSEGRPIDKIPFFYSVNALGLIDIEDCEKISTALEQARRKILSDNKTN